MSDDRWKDTYDQWKLASPYDDMGDEAEEEKMLVDTKCVELARHFLSDFATAGDADVRELSERIQATVEEFCTVAFNVPPSEPDDEPVKPMPDEEPLF